MPAAAAILALLAAGSALAANGPGRNATTRRHFVAAHPCPATGRPSGPCPGWIVDHIVPLRRGGADDPRNMQWQTVAAAMIWANVEDSGADLGEKWEIDETRLAQRLRGMPRSTLMAIGEAVDRFWERHRMPTDEALAAAGVKILKSATP